MGTIRSQSAVSQMKSKLTRSWLFLLPAAIQIAFAGSCCPKQLACPTPAPENFVEARAADGELVSASLGAGGGRLSLGAMLPSLLVPPGALSSVGLTFQLKKVELQSSDVPRGTAASIPFEIGPGGTMAQLEHAFVVSNALKPLPTECTLDNLRLAVQVPSTTGPSAPTLAWQYERALYDGEKIWAVLVRIAGHRLQFTCVSG